MSALAAVQQRIEAEIMLSGAQVAVWFHDMADGETLKLNPDRLYPLASVIKLPIMVALMRLAEEGQLRLDETIALDLSAPDYVQDGGSGVLTYLTSKVTLSIRDLIALMIIDSDNLATNVLLRRIPPIVINATLDQLGLAETRVTHLIEDFPTLRQDGSNAGTARELGVLLQNMYALELPSSDLMIELLNQQKFNARIPYFLPTDNNDDLKIAHKTGTLIGLSHDAGLVMTPDFNYGLVVLVRHQTSAIAAALLIARISEILYGYMTDKPRA